MMTNEGKAGQQTEPGNLLVALISSISSPPAERAVTHQQAALEGPGAV